MSEEEQGGNASSSFDDASSQCQYLEDEDVVEENVITVLKFTGGNSSSKNFSTGQLIGGFRPSINLE